MRNDAIHGDEHIQMIDGLTKYQLFAVNHYLQEYDQDATFEQVLAELVNTIDGSVPFEIYDASLSWEEIADSIIQMAADLERLMQ